MKITFLALTLSLVISPGYQQFAANLLQGAVSQTTELDQSAELHKTIVDLYKKNQFSEALPLAQKSLEIRQRLLPATDQRVEECLEYLGLILYATGDRKAAKVPLELAVKLKEARLGADSFELVPILDRLALAYFASGDSDKSEITLRRVISLKEKKFGLDNINLAVSLSSLANIYRSRRDLKHGGPTYMRALRLLGSKSGVESPEFTLVGNNFLCMAYENMPNDLVKEFGLLKKQLRGNDADSGDEVLNGRALSLPRPSYPIEARNAHVDGTVIIKVWIDESGHVYKAAPFCGDRFH